MQEETKNTNHNNLFDWKPQFIKTKEECINESRDWLEKNPELYRLNIFPPSKTHPGFFLRPQPLCFDYRFKFEIDKQNVDADQLNKVKAHLEFKKIEFKKNGLIVHPSECSECRAELDHNTKTYLLRVTVFLIKIN